MTDPEIAGTTPHLCDLEPGTFFWCSCGRSAGQPFCDGSHRGTGLGPVRFEVPEQRKGALCLCKRTGNRPWCDGSHADL